MKQVLCVALAVVLAAGLCACEAGEAAEAKTTIAEPTTAEPLSVADSFYEWDQRQPLLIAQDEDNHLYLYGLPGYGWGNERVVLIWYDPTKTRYGESGSYHGESAYFEWNYFTPHGDVPVMKVFDADGDGEKEVIVKTHAGTGTGVRIYDLHVVELIPRKERWDEREQAWVWEDVSWEDTYERVVFEDHFFAPEDIQAQMDKAISYVIDAGEGKIILTDGKAQIIRDLPFISQGNESHKLDMTNLIDFSFKESSISLEAGIGYQQDGACLGTIIANVNYKNGAFTLTDISLSE